MAFADFIGASNWINKQGELTEIIAVDLSGCIKGRNMKKEEFLKKWDKETLEYNNFVIGEKTNVPYSKGCYQEGENWNIYGIGERQNFVITAQGTEEEMFEKLDKILKGEIKLKERRERANQ